MTIGLQWMCGWDDWYAINPVTALGNGSQRFTIASFSSTATGGHVSALLVTGAAGRQARGQSMALSQSFVVNTPTMLLATFTTGGVSTLSDGTSLYMGFNAYLGCTNGGLIPNTGSPTGTGGYCRIWGFAAGSPGAPTGGATTHRVAFWYDVGSNSFVATKGSGTPPGGTGTPLTAVASGQPTRNPWQQWTYYEVHVYRSATSGQIDLWVENSGGTLDHLLAATAIDTSVATLGSISLGFIGGGYFNTGVSFAVEYDDFWLALSGSPGVPSYVVTVPAQSGSETSQSGPAVGGWTPTPSGGTNGSVVDELLLDTTDYTSYALSTGAQGNTMSILFPQQALPYTPNSIAAIMSLSWMTKRSTVSGTTASTNAVCWSRIRKGATDYDGNAGAVTNSTVSGTPASSTGETSIQGFGRVLELDPDTGLAWTPSAANGVLMGGAASGSIAATGVGSPVVALYGVNMLYLASIAAASTGAAGGGSSSGSQVFNHPQHG